METQINEHEYNNFTTMSMRDYLEFSFVEGYKYGLVGFITPKQRIFNVANRRINDETIMEDDLGREIYEVDYPTPMINGECIRLYSCGKNLSVEFPDEITQEQFECLQDVLRDIRSFEFDFDRIVYMPRNSRELVEVASNLITQEERVYEPEKIIGVPLLSRGMRLEKKRNQ